MRILRFGRKAEPVPQFEEAIARLSDELALTENFARQMIRDGHYKAAAAVVEEQTTRMKGHHMAMLSAFRPNVRRIQLAAGGIAAVMLLGSASLILVGSQSPEPKQQSAPEIVNTVTEKIAHAAGALTDAEATRYVTSALGDLASLHQGGPAAPESPKLDGIDLTRELDALLREHPQMAALVRRLVAAARASKVEVNPAVQIPSPPSSASSKPSPNPKSSSKPSHPKQSSSPSPEPAPTTPAPPPTP